MQLSTPLRKCLPTMRAISIERETDPANSVSHLMRGPELNSCGKVIDASLQYRLQNRDKFLEYRALNKRKLQDYSLQNEDKTKQKKREYYMMNRSSFQSYSMQNKEMIKLAKQRYSRHYSESVKEMKHVYYLQNQDTQRETKRQYYLRRHTNPAAYLPREQGYKSWKTPEHVREYFASIAPRLRIASNHDWYRISRPQIRSLGGVYRPELIRCFLF